MCRESLSVVISSALPAIAQDAQQREFVVFNHYDMPAVGLLVDDNPSAGQDDAGSRGVTRDEVSK
jgi:hypothetical protein